MLSKKEYLIHFVRLFFSGILLGICSLVSHLWNVYQPLYFDFHLERCQINSSINKCHSYVIEDYPININKYLGLIHFLFVIIFIYYLIRLSLFHTYMKQYEEKQIYYAHLYRQDGKKRCLNRLLKT